MELLGYMGHMHVDLVSVHLENVLVSVQDMFIVCAKHTIGSEIIFDAPVSASRSRGSSGSAIQSIWR
jgi:hypothetical protein